MSNNPEILVITSYPPRVCGIATYSQDLITALNKKFGKSFSIKVCALENEYEKYDYPEEVKFILDTSVSSEYSTLAHQINQSKQIKIVLIQHEFGFYENHEEDLLQMMKKIRKPLMLVFHTVIPHPGESLKSKVKSMIDAASSIIVMTNGASRILLNEYDAEAQKITVIAHGTHLVPHINRNLLKEKYRLSGRKVLTTFGLLSSGKSIETTLDALPDIIKSCPEVIFLVIGKTHPMVIKSEGERYRNMLEAKVAELELNDHVRFINNYLALPELLEFLQLTDIYLFTTNDPNQAVSGTFVYAMSCACPIISTPIPHAVEVLTKDTGIIIDFRNSDQLAAAVNRLLNDEPLMDSMSTNTLQKIVSTSWGNSAIAHAILFEQQSEGEIKIIYSIPEINLDHIKKLTTGFGMIQFSKINQPDIESGYTLDDNARALVALCMHYELTSDEGDLAYIQKYLAFIRHCMQTKGNFLNYVDKDIKFTNQNNTNLDDANGRAIWALGYMISRSSVLPQALISNAKSIIQTAMPRIESILSARAMAFAIKGLYYYNSEVEAEKNSALITILADRLADMYKRESVKKWEWFESYLTYANSVLPEAMLYAWQMTGNNLYKSIAEKSFRFLLSSIFNERGIEVISSKSRLNRGGEAGKYGEQPIDVAYTIMTLNKFYEESGDKEYLEKMHIAFDWFSGNNRLHQIVYNPCTGGCYDGLEETHVNLNQGAESAVSYLMARLTIEK
ncbi:MAG: mannosyltransferase [Bacteroidetes bacterium GWF2_40_14]|nr:MAG: mannosyltransferase [Bacteroidetes bacterium GWF2_40_14]